MNGSNNIKNVDKKGVSKIYKIFEEIYLKAPTFLKDLLNNSVGIDNTESIREQIDFKKIDTKFKNGEYCHITDAMKDIRTVFLNCYSLYGARSSHTKQSLELEELLEEKISYLDKNNKLLADVNLTLNLLNMEGKSSSKLRYPKDCYDSVLLRSVAHCRPERLKKYHETLSTTLTTDKDNAHILEKILSWENKVNFNDVFHQYISSMWELPEIGNFLAILFKKLDLDIINQGEIERMFLMPKESTTMGKIMTTLLVPIKKTKCISRVMPYKVWSEKLSKKVSNWCKVYHTKNQNKVIAMDLLGIHPDFWTVVNEKNPLIEKDYSELSYFIRVWLVKGLCDYATIKFKTINDIVTNCNARQCTIWKNDLETEEYFFFDSMPDLRIYYYNIPYDEPRLEFLGSEKTDNEVVEFEDKLTMNGFSESFHTVQKGKHFKLIADSVESLRAFVNELDMEGKSVPESLISSLENFIVNIEPEEYHYITMNNDSKLLLFKDLVSYSDRIQKDKDNISVWEKKNSKSIAKTKNEELIITEKRKRKSIVHQTFDINESDEYFTENDKSLSEFTDSEDEWGAMNHPKFKAKQPQQTPSKLFLELEKRVMEAGKMLKYDTKQSDVNQLRCKDKISKRSTYKRRKTNNEDKSIKSVKLPKNQNEEKLCINNTNTLALVNGNNKVKQPLQTLPKRIKLDKQLREENAILKHGSIKGFDKKDKNMKPFKLLKTQNEKKCSNNTNTFFNGDNQRLVGTENTDIVCSNEEVVLVHSDKEESQKPSDGSRQVEIITLDEDMQNDCEAGKMLKYDTKQSDVKQLRYEAKISKRSTHKMCKTNNEDKSITSVKLLKNQNEEKICINNTNTLALVNGNNKVEPPLQTLPKPNKLDKQLREENAILKHGSIKGFDKKDKNMKPFKLLKTQNEKKCSNNTNTFFNGDNQRLVGTEYTDIVCSNEKVVLVHNDKEESQKPSDGLRRVKIKTLDEDMQNDCEAGKMLKYDTKQSDVKQLRYEAKISKRSTHKMCKTNNEDKSITSVKLLKNQNEEKICINNTNTLALVNGNNKVEPPLQTLPKPNKLDKQLREENAILKHGSIKGFDKKDKNMKPFKLLKTQNEKKCSNNTNTFFNGDNQRLVGTENTDIVCSNEKVVLVHNDKEESQKPSDGLRRVKIKTLDEDMQNDCEAGKMLKYDTKQSDVKQLRYEAKISKRSTHKMCKTNNEDKSIKSVKLLKNQNEEKICINNTNTLALVNGNNKVKQPLQTLPKRIKLDKQLREENAILKHGSIKGFDKKDKNMKPFKLLKTQNEKKFSNNTNTFFNGDNQRLVGTENTDIVCSNEEVVLVHSDKEESQKPSDGSRQVEIITLDEDMQNDCEVFNDNFQSSTCTENKNRKSNKQKNYKQIESSVILIDDDPTIFSDGEDGVQFISMTEKPKCSPLKNNKPCSLKTHLNKSYNSVSANRRITPTNYINHKATSSIIDKLSPNVTIMPANINIPKGIEVTMIKTPQTMIDSNIYSVKRNSTMSNAHPSDNPSTINVKCELISKPNINGEVKFYVRLPNGENHPGPNELINQYLKQHNNQLPDYWLVPLPVEVAKQYGFN